MKSFVHLVNERMSGQSLSLRKVAKGAGLDPSFFSKVLAGKRSPPSDEKVLVKLAKCLGIDPMALVISTGLIPSELQPLMEKPEFLRSLYGRAGFRPQRVPPPKAAGRAKPSAPRFKQRRNWPRGISKSPHLSEDLLCPASKNRTWPGNAALRSLRPGTALIRLY